MKLCLKTCSRHIEPQQADLTLSERLPVHIVSECHVHCDYLVKSFPAYYLLILNVSGVIPVCCQRCLGEYSLDYMNHTELAICRDDKTALKLMDEYECVVLDRFEIDLREIITDELHLYAPEKHREGYCQ